MAKKFREKTQKNFFESETFFENRLSIRSEWQKTSSEKKLKKIFLK
ncbi:conserved domain protein [Ruminococcus albus 8]|uniref:Conserved domain protein n=1 Tax=Ruminococcus albus 8 TaxID=246199 RepID=E9S799_RUMAL|nr:conserved domain protein [Ruminococcus albus 8]